MVLRGSRDSRAREFFGHCFHQSTLIVDLEIVFINWDCRFLNRQVHKSGSDRDLQVLEIKVLVTGYSGNQEQFFCGFVFCVLG